MDTKPFEVMVNTAVALRLYKAFREQRRTYPELMLLTGLGKSTVIRCLLDQRAMQLNTFIRVASALGLSAATVLSEAERDVTMVSGWSGTDPL